MGLYLPTITRTRPDGTKVRTKSRKWRGVEIERLSGKRGVAVANRNRARGPAAGDGLGPRLTKGR